MNSQIPPLLRQHDIALRDLCRLYGVERLELFGSGTTADFNPVTSDLDFIVTMHNQRQAGYARRFCDFADALEKLLNLPVDLVTDAMIRNPYFKAEVNKTRELVIQA